MANSTSGSAFPNGSLGGWLGRTRGCEQTKRRSTFCRTMWIPIRRSRILFLWSDNGSRGRRSFNANTGARAKPPSVCVRTRGTWRAASGAARRCWARSAQEALHSLLARAQAESDQNCRDTKINGCDIIYSCYAADAEFLSFLQGTSPRRP